MTLSFNLAHLETILVHPTRRQSFANTVQPHWTQDLTPRHKASFKVVLFSCHDRVWSGKVERRALVQEVVRNSVNIYPLSFCAVAQGLEKPSVVWQLKLSRYIFFRIRCRRPVSRFATNKSWHPLLRKQHQKILLSGYLDSASLFLLSA